MTAANPPLVARIVSGGQTGVDRAALDVAVALGLPYAGWCPAGGWAEDLPEPPGLLARYPGLRATPGTDPADRTRRNVVGSDAVLVCTTGRASPGTDATVAAALDAGRPLLVADPTDPEAAANVVAWLAGLDQPALDVAGPRASEWADAYSATRDLLERVLAHPSRG